MNSLTKKIFGAASVLMLAFNLAACGENDADIARKPALVDQIAADSLQKCDTGKPSYDDSTYETRLRAVLKGTDSKALDAYIRKGITICLDPRLSQQKLGFFDQTIEGVYYNNGEHAIVGLYDNGVRSINTAGWDSNMLERLVDSFRYGNIMPSDHLLFAGIYGVKLRYSSWHRPANFDADSQQKNPQLLTPPLRQP